MNYDNNEKKQESVYSTRIRAGKRRTYFFDVRATRANDYFLTITESRKRFDDNGYDRHKVFLYKEDFNKFLKALTEALDFVKTDLMPDFDFDAFNHEEENATAFDGKETAFDKAISVATPQQVATPHVEEVPDIDPETITEKKPLEARDTPASAGDNLSGEEVDKW
ncbi:MAG: DUF3276 family protein [Chitinophagaceae bacterium]|nr:PUR family DNA/RNA-binding protein [Sediminibacterium sp.]